MHSLPKGQLCPLSVGAWIASTQLCSHADLGTVNQAHMVTARLDGCPLHGVEAQEDSTAKEGSE